MKAAVFSCVAGSVVAAPSSDVIAKFDEFRTKWGRIYNGVEYTKRLQYFESHLQHVEDIQRQEVGTATYTHLGPFADLSPEELKLRFGLLPSETFAQLPTAPLLNKTLADSFDWVSKGAVNPVKDQGQCGSCWAFSTVANLEGTGFVSGGKLVSLSEQNIMDCDKTCYSCNGGLPSLALTWSAKWGGVASEKDYPYRASDHACRNIGALTHNKGYNKISQNEDQIAQALTTYGPLSIAVDATPFQSYSGGVMNNPSCSKTRIDHAVNIVGYGFDKIQYWKIRNSWAATWGEQGYIRVSRGDCTCALCTTVVTATGVTVSNAPSPTPPGPSPGCEDILPICPSQGSWECKIRTKECQKSCGCCLGDAPDYCATPEVELGAAGIPWDEILKLVCQELENGSTEPEAEKLICGKLKNNLEIEGCDKLVEFAWSSITKKDCPSGLGAAGIPWDEILKLVCQELENGSTESEAEQLICGKLKNNLEIEGCDKLVEFAWSSITKKDCPSGLSHTLPTIV